MKILKFAASLLMSCTLLTAPFSAALPTDADPFITAYAEETKIQKGVSSITQNFITEGFCELFAKDGYILLTCERPNGYIADGEIITVNGSTGEILGRLPLDSFDYNVRQMKNGSFCRLSGDNTLITYSARCEKTGEYKVPKDIFYYAVNDDVTTMIYNNSNGDVMLYDLKNSAEIPLSAKINTYDLKYCDGMFIARTNMEFTYGVSPNGTVKIIGDSDLYYYPTEVTEKPWGGYRFQNVKTGKTVNVVTDTSEGWVTDAAENAFASWYDNRIITIYNLSNMRSVKLEFENADNISNIKFMDNNTIVTTVHKQSGYEICRIDLREIEYTDSIKSISDAEVNKLTRDKQQKDIAQSFVEPEDNEFTPASRLKKIYDTYGVRIFFDATDSMMTGINDIGYALTLPVDKEERTQCIDAIESYLKDLPAGMVREASDGADLCILVADYVYDYNGPDNWGGFYTGSMSFPLIVFEKYSMQTISTVAHEFYHFFEGKLSPSKLHDWQTLSPEDGYINSVASESWSGANDYAAESGDVNPENVYFIRRYARANPREDRAVIAETIYSAYKDSEYLYYFDMPHIKEKALYFCDMFRESYSCLANCENVYWEKTLGYVPKKPAPVTTTATETTTTVTVTSTTEALSDTTETAAGNVTEESGDQNKKSSIRIVIVCCAAVVLVLSGVTVFVVIRQKKENDSDDVL